MLAKKTPALLDNKYSGVDDIQRSDEPLYLAEDKEATEGVIRPTEEEGEVNNFK